ncbi:MAG: HAD family hydrolase [Campylobacterales bacterium]|nr:HAD family hydrolase [Campylobacterales bacterium]
MKYKGILLDIDNTLYEYKKTHKIALSQVLEFCNSRFKIEINELESAYNVARKKVHIELSETASSHNRLLYIQKMLEILNINSLQYSLEIYEVYWSTFLKNIEVYDGVYEFLEKYKNKICLITDLTAHIQHRKIAQLNLSNYIDKVVTSEEVGREKPHPYMFMLSLKKLGLNIDDVCMIGDSFKKDIFGASNLGIQSIWLNQEEKSEEYNTTLVTEVKNFDEILELV